MSNIYSLIMAGGSGTRFWPRSRDKKPKQFLSIFGNETLIESSINRFTPFTGKENIYIISKALQKEEIEKQNLAVLPENILYEPTGKNTLPCIGLAALFINRKDKDGIIIVSPADQLIDNLPVFNETIKTACQIAAAKDGIVTIGISPTRPATGYGYVQTAQTITTDSKTKAFTVKKFVEKPNLEKAKKYCKSGEFFWNSGIFVFKCSVLWEAIKRFTPDIYESLMQIESYIGTPEYEEKLNSIYGVIDSISIDYAIMEKAENVYLVQGDFGWNDLGSWEQVYELSKKDAQNNASVGKVILEDTQNSYIYSETGIIALLGLDNVIVVQSGNATLVAKREKGEDIKKVVQRLKTLQLKAYM